VWCVCVDVDVDVDHHSITVWRDDGKAIHAVLVLVLGKVVSSVALRLLGLLLCYYCYNSGSVGRTVCICIIIDDGCGCGSVRTVLSKRTALKAKVKVMVSLQLLLYCTAVSS
jgi:hypothetical protein